MSESISNLAESKNLQNLFAEYNQRYFGDRLPWYKILLKITSVDAKGVSGEFTSIDKPKWCMLQ